MNFLKIILLFTIPINALIAQKNIIENIFHQNIFREDFHEKSAFFPIEKNGDKFSVILEKTGEYFIGTGASNHIIMMGWENDLLNFELKTAFKLAPEEGLNLFQTEDPQSFGIILKYNPDTQEGLIFETNSNRQYRLVYITNNKNKHLTYSKDDGWIKSEHLRKNAKNEILIKTHDDNYEFHINGEFVFKTNLKNKRINNLTKGRFGLHLAPQTKSKIDYLYISTTKDYNGINKTLTFTQKEIKKIIEENTLLKDNKNHIESSQINELKNVIQILENELKNINLINDSLKLKNKEFEPFLDIMGENKDFLYTLSKDLKQQIEKNQSLKTENNKLLDSIEILIQNQEIFKLEYLKALDSMREQTTQDTIKLNEK